MNRTDVHQHLWPEGFIAAPARRRRAPRLVRDGRDRRLVAAGEAHSPLGAAAWDLARRSASLATGPEHGRAASTPPSPWWPALTDHVASLQSAWLAFSTWGRRAHPRLRVVFAALAGLAPLHAERLAARGGPRGATTDPLVFYDTSSYGHRAIDATVRMVGVHALVHGSDRPVVDAVPPHGLWRATRSPTPRSCARWPRKTTSPRSPRRSTRSPSPRHSPPEGALSGRAVR